MINNKQKNRIKSNLAIHMRSGIALATVVIASMACAQDIRATVNGEQVDFYGVQPLMINSRVMVPVRGVFEHMNASVIWNENERTVVAHRGMDHIILTVNSYIANVNGEDMRLDTPAVIKSGRTLVPLRFLSESLRAGVEWNASSRTVEITTSRMNNDPPIFADYVVRRIEAGTVIPFQLNERLTSNNSKVGDRFTADLDTGDSSNYQYLPAGAVLQGHVNIARAKDGDTPGVLGLAFDRVKMPNGQTFKIHGSLIGLDSKSVTNEDGRLVAKADAKNDDLKYVGYGAGGGAIIALLTKGNLLSNTLIGAALGFLYGEIRKDPSKSNNVTLEPDTKFGVRLTQDASFQVDKSAK